MQFNYGNSQGIGFVARLEEDPEFPENKAHANVYNPNKPSKRKTMAQKLAQTFCSVVVEPTLSDSTW